MCSAPIPNMPPTTEAATTSGVEISLPSNGGLMPFGLPVVPELYNILAPRGCAVNGSIGKSATAS